MQDTGYCTLPKLMTKPQRHLYVLRSSTLFPHLQHPASPRQRRPVAGRAARLHPQQQRRHGRRLLRLPRAARVGTRGRPLLYGKVGSRLRSGTQVGAQYGGQGQRGLCRGAVAGVGAPVGTCAQDGAA